jgi:hypothetical protein
MVRRSGNSIKANTHAAFSLILHTAVTLILVTTVTLPGCSIQVSDFPVVQGWTQVGGVSVYDPDNLWEYIDGAAELFIDYGVLACRTADLSSGDVTVTVDIYDMGTSLNAFGIFTLESSGRGEPFPGAVEAVISPPFQALLLKGTMYVKAHPFEGELTTATGRELLEGLARALPGRPVYPRELDLMPREGRITGSEGYQATGFLGIAELTNCIYAEYAGEGDESWTGFLIQTSSGSPYIWSDLAGKWESVEHNGMTVLYDDIPYRGLVGIVNTGRGIIGVSGADDLAELLRMLDGFIR